MLNNKVCLKIFVISCCYLSLDRCDRDKQHSICWALVAMTKSNCLVIWLTISIDISYDGWNNSGTDAIGICNQPIRNLSAYFSFRIAIVERYLPYGQLYNKTLRGLLADRIYCYITVRGTSATVLNYQRQGQ